MPKEIVILTEKQGFYAKGERVLVKNADELVKSGKATRPVKKAVKKVADKKVVKKESKAKE